MKKKVDFCLDSEDSLQGDGGKGSGHHGDEEWDAGHLHGAATVLLVVRVLNWRGGWSGDGSVGTVSGRWRASDGWGADGSSVCGWAQGSEDLSLWGNGKDLDDTAWLDGSSLRVGWSSAGAGYQGGLDGGGVNSLENDDWVFLSSEGDLEETEEDGKEDGENREGTHFELVVVMEKDCWFCVVEGVVFGLSSKEAL